MTALSLRRWGGGGARVALCWHGAGGSGEDFGDLAARLAPAGFTVLAVDGPGHGSSAPVPADEMRASALARLAAKTADDAGADKVVFIGFSWGATIACSFGSLWPERTAALVLLEGGHLDFADLPDFEPPRAGDDVETAMIRGLYLEPATATYDSLAAAAIPLLFVGRPISAAAVRQLSFDPLERLRSRVPQATIVTLDGSDHELLSSDPTRVAETVITWLSCHP